MMNTESAPKDFGFGEDEAMLRDAARRLLDDRMPLEALRALVAASPESVYSEGQPAPWNTALWAEIVELGWTALAVGEDQGGLDLSMAGIAGMIEEVGRHALPSPLLPTLAASFALRAADTEVSRHLLAQIAGGTAATLAITNEQGSWEPEATPVAAKNDGDQLVLNGSARFVQDALKSKLIITSAQLGNAVVLCAVDAMTPGVTVDADHIHDLTRDQCSVHFDNVRLPASALITGHGGDVLQAVWPRMLLLVTADLCGASEWLLQATVQYARDRVQFDRPIGFFQAVKHPLVDAMVEIDRARSLLYHACAEVDIGSDDAEVAARMAKSAAFDAAGFISDRAIQLHGGIGFTWEYALHIFFKRNLHNQALLGDGVFQRAKLANRLMGPTHVAA